MINNIISIIDEQLSDVFEKNKMEFLYVDNQLNKNASNSILIFNKKYKLPLYFAKFPKLPVYNYIIENEYNALRVLSDNLPSSISEAIVSDFRYYKKNELSILVLPYFPNITLNKMLRSNFISNKSKIEMIDKCCKWLINFQKNTVHLKNKNTQAIDKDLIRYLDYFERKRLNIDKSKFKIARTIIISFLKDSKEKVYSHGDYWSGNILINSNKNIKIIDWPNFNKEHFPAWDFLSFFLTLKQELKNRTLNIQINELEKDYFEKLNIESDLLMSFKIIYSAIRSFQSEYNYGTFNKYDKIWEQSLQQLLFSYNIKKMY
jgi:thiamine kinase-like enzyme